MSRLLRIYIPVYQSDTKSVSVPTRAFLPRSTQYLRIFPTFFHPDGLVLNLKTGHISPQFHVVYDERFETVTTNMSIDLAETWIDLWKNSRDFYLDSWDEELDGKMPKTDAGFDPNELSNDKETEENKDIAT